jgi:hypothetical protein
MLATIYATMGLYGFRCNRESIQEFGQLCVKRGVEPHILDGSVAALRDGEWKLTEFLNQWLPGGK